MLCSFKELIYCSLLQAPRLLGSHLPGSQAPRLPGSKVLTFHGSQVVSNSFFSFYFLYRLFRQLLLNDASALDDIRTSIKFEHVERKSIT